MNGIFADNTFWSKKTNSERHIRQIAFSLLMLIENNTNSLALENAKRKGTSPAPLPVDFLSVSIESLVFVPRIGMNSGPRVHRLFLFNFYKMIGIRFDFIRREVRGMIYVRLFTNLPYCIPYIHVSGSISLRF